MNNYLFVDIETTGLDHTINCILEISMYKVTDDFTPLSSRHFILKPINTAVSDDFCVKMHTENGLFQDCNLYGMELLDVNANILEFLGDRNGWIPAGNSVHFDRRFLEFYFPALRTKFHYRNLDLTCCKLLFNRKILLPYGDKLHRSEPDVLNSIYMARHYYSLLGKLQ